MSAKAVRGGVEDCAKIVDMAIQHHPEISALVWAGARFILMVGRLSGFSLACTTVPFQGSGDIDIPINSDTNCVNS